MKVILVLCIHPLQLLLTGKDSYFSFTIFKLGMKTTVFDLEEKQEVSWNLGYGISIYDLGVFTDLGLSGLLWTTVPISIVHWVF